MAKDAVLMKIVKEDKKMKKCRLAAAAVILSVAAGMTANAGQWKADGNGWWYDRGDGTWPANGWEWVDGNGDGIAECYYFDGSGYCLLNTTTPDNHAVDGNGAWVVNGEIQTQPAVSGGNETGTVENVSYVGLYALAGWPLDYMDGAYEYMPLGLGNPAIRIDSYSGGVIQGHYYDGSTGASLELVCDFQEAVDSNGHFRKVLPHSGYEFTLDFYLQESNGNKSIKLKKTVVKYADFEVAANDYDKEELEYGKEYYNREEQFVEYH